MAASAEGLTGILLIDKPAGWTSHDVVARARAITRQRRIGHTGTLDPMATGLLVLCLGRATRLVEYMTAHDKRYEGLIQLGVATTTDDAEGEPVERGDLPDLDAEALSVLVDRFSGTQLQVPPAFSAVKIGGRRAYDAARAGSPLALQPRSVTVSELHLELRAPGQVAIRLRCSAGTYVRSLARDIGATLGCGGHLAALRRLGAGPFTIDQAITLERLQQLAGAARLEDVLLPLDDGVLDRAAAILSRQHCRQLATCAPALVDGPFQPTDLARIYSVDGEFFGVGTVRSDGQIQPIKVLLETSWTL